MRGPTGAPALDQIPIRPYNGATARLSRARARRPTGPAAGSGRQAGWFATASFPRSWMPLRSGWSYRMVVEVEIGRFREEGPTYTVRLPVATVHLSVVTFQ